MPAYDYIEEATGQTVELMVPMAQRDSVPGHRRVAVPPRVNAVGFAPDIHSQAFGVREGLKDMETRYGRDCIRRDTGMGVEQLKRIWSN